jgi:hypothetical protein
MTSGVVNNLGGKRFGKLLVKPTVLRKRTKNGSVKLLWLCECSCGNTKYIVSASLTNGLTKSCGCLIREKTSERRFVHGMGRTPTYTSWRAMLERCTNPNSSRYANYGGRGIKVCPQWGASFTAFLEDMGERPANSTLDRVDNNKGYFKSNCRWVLKGDQAKNTSRTWRIAIKGRVQCLKQWCDELSLDYKRVLGRLRLGWSIQKALDMPLAEPVFMHKQSYDSEEETK